jgi:hypothetical protein
MSNVFTSASVEVAPEEKNMEKQRSAVLSTISSTVGVVSAGTGLIGAVIGSVPVMGAAAVLGVAALAVTATPASASPTNTRQPSSPQTTSVVD